MSGKDNKLTPEQLKKLQQLQALMMQKQAQGQGAAGGVNPMQAGPKPPLAKRIFISILQTMSNCVKFVDQFIDLVVKKDGGSANDVVKSARSPILFGVFVTVFFVLFGLIWSATAPLDSAAVAIGSVVSKSQKKTVNHQEGGTVKEIYVQPGDSVKKGDPLLEFNDVRIRARYQGALHQYKTLAATEARLLAELEGESNITFPEFLLEDADNKLTAKILETQKKLFSSKQDYIKAEKDSLGQKVQQMEKRVESLKAKSSSLNKTHEVFQDRLEATRKLNEKGYAQKATLLELEAKLSNAESEIAVNELDIISAEQEITRMNIELINLENKFATEVSSELNKIQTDLNSVKEEYQSLEDILDKVILRSPVDGVVNNLNYHTVGSTIPPGATIMEISPHDDSLIIHAKIPPKNIDSIRIGLKSKIRFSAFKSRTSPMFFGEVISLSPDIIVDIPQSGQTMNAQNNTQETAAGYYLARIEMDMDHFNKLAKPRKLSLVPGMQAEVQIITGTRTLLQYLLDPIYDAMFKGFKER